MRLRIQPAPSRVVKVRLKLGQIVFCNCKHVVVLVTEVRTNWPAFLGIFLVIMNSHKSCPEQVFEDSLCILSQFCQLLICGPIYLLFGIV